MEKLKKVKNYLLAFIIPFIICIAIFYAKGVLQDIEDIYVSDLRLQHIVFLNYLKNILLGKASIYYSFSAGMGCQMLSTVIFYCISPINILLLFINDIRYAILIIYFTKVSLAGLTTFILLKSRTNNNDFKTILFSSCYAVSAFAINYFFCGFWFDVLYLAPLVIMGIDKMFKTEKINLLYIISLALAIICNIQMGFGLCVFSLVYYLYSYSINYEIKRDFKKFKQLSLIFIVSSICAAAISSGALLGFASDYAKISSAREIKVTTETTATNVLYVLKNLFTVGNLKQDYYNNFEPFVYAGLIVSFFSILYLFNSEIDKKKRTAALGVIITFFISFSIKFINLFWHLSSPVLLNFRYSIYLCLFLTILAYECYITKNKLTSKDITIMTISLVLGLFAVIAFSMETYVVWTFVFLLVIFTLIVLAKNKNKKFEILLFILVIAEIFTNGYLSIYTANDLPYGKYNAYDDLKKLASYNDFDDNYRVLYNYTYTDNTNDTLLLNKNSSLRYFSSIINGDVNIFFNRNLSRVGNNNYMISGYDSPLLLSLMGNKYFYFTADLSNSIYKKINTYEMKSYNYVTQKKEENDVYLYENPYALSIGYVVEEDVKFDKDMDLVAYQNEILKAFTGRGEDALIRLDYNIAEDSEICSNTNFYSCLTYDITNNTSNTLTYIYGMFDQYSIENSPKNYLDVNKPIIISTINKSITITFEYSGQLTKEYFTAMTYDEDKLIDNLSYLQENMMTDIKVKDNVMTGKINSSKNGILFLSIPYDEKFSIYVDGKKVKHYSMLDNAFIGLDITEGEHDIKVEYIDENLKLYILLTISAIIITAVLYYFINKKIDKRHEEEKIIEEQLKEKKTKQKENKKTKKNKKRR